jgi:hypothetical protein
MKSLLLENENSHDFDDKNDIDNGINNNNENIEITSIINDNDDNNNRLSSNKYNHKTVSKKEIISSDSLDDILSKAIHR